MTRPLALTEGSTLAAILDELGYLPFPESGGALPFHPIGQLYEKTSPITTTDLDFGGWAQAPTCG